MTVQERSRRLIWENCLNARDLGGYPTTDGGETRWGAVVRADNLALLTDAGQAALVDYGVRTIVDLRLPRELEEHPNPFARSGSHGIAYRNISFIDPAAAPSPNAESLVQDYTRMLDQFSSSVSDVIQAIARAPEGGVLIHCMAGKDRTGIISALLLDLAGVPRRTIGEDYALTAECLRQSDEEWLENGPGERAERERVLEKYRPRPEVMMAVLAHLDERYGGTEAYLLTAGVPPQDLERLRGRLRQPA